MSICFLYITYFSSVCHQDPSFLLFLSLWVCIIWKFKTLHAVFFVSFWVSSMCWSISRNLGSFSTYLHTILCVLFPGLQLATVCITWHCLIVTGLVLTDNFSLLFRFSNTLIHIKLAIALLPESSSDSVTLRNLNLQVLLSYDYLFP